MILSQENFIKEIEKVVRKHNGEITYLEAISKICSTNNIDLEVAASIVKANQNLKAKIRRQEEELHTIKKRTNRLPIVSK